VKQRLSVAKLNYVVIVVLSTKQAKTRILKQRLCRNVLKQRKPLQFSKKSQLRLQ
jgi:hypothetical protein